MLGADFASFAGFFARFAVKDFALETVREALNRKGRKERN